MWIIKINEIVIMNLNLFFKTILDILHILILIQNNYSNC